MKYQRNQVRRESEGYTTLYRGKDSGMIALLAVREFKGLVTVFDNGEDYELAYPTRLIHTGDSATAVSFLLRKGISHQTPTVLDAGLAGGF